MKAIPAFCTAFCSILLPASAAVFSHYSFDSNFNDGSGNDRHGTLTDVGTTGNSGITDTPGEFVFGDGAMNFSADRDYLAIPSQTFSSGVPYTIAFWARKTAGDTGDSAQWDMVLGRRDVTSFFIALNDATGTGDRDGLRWRSSDGTAGRNANFVTSDDSNWHHYAVVADGSTVTLFLDGGSPVTTSGKSTGFIFDTIGEAYTSGRDFDFHGQLDEMWIFDEALDATAISNLEAFNSIVPEPGTTALAALAALGLLRRRR